MEFYVYAHKRKSDGSVFYIGKGKGGRAYRLSNRSEYWSRVERKHGLIIEIVADNLSESDAFELECFMIEEIGIENLVNLTAGGEGLSGLKFSEEHKRKISESNKGRPIDWDRVERARRANLGRPLSREHREALSRAGKGRKKSLEHIAKVAAARRGKSHTPEGKQNIRKSRCRVIECIETGKTFYGGHHAAEWLRDNGWPKASQASVNRACNGKIRTSYGYTWRFVDENTRANEFNNCAD